MTEVPTKPPTSSVVDRILLRQREAAELLAISERSLWSLQARGAIPTVRLSKHCVRYRRADLESWAEKHASTSRDPIAIRSDRKDAP